MIYKEALEMWQIFTVAAQDAKRKNKIEPEFHMSVEELVGYFKKAFPKQKDEEKFVEIAKKILENNEE